MLLFDFLGRINMKNLEKIIAFVEPYYISKDIMHDFSHINRILKMVETLSEKLAIKFDNELVMIACYFHGLIGFEKQKIEVF